MSDRRRASQRANGAKGAAVQRANRKGKTKTCAREGCGATFYVPPGKIATTKFCSHRCGADAKRTPMPSCEVCGDPASSRQSKTCRKAACRSEIRARSKRGSLNPMAGPRTSRKREWFAAKEASCRCCGSTRLLKQHHVVYEQHVRKYGGDIYDPRNGLTLCMTCHNKHHHDADGRLSTNDLRAENIEFAFELLGAYTADYFVRYYDDDSGGALMARSVALQEAA